MIISLIGACAFRILWVMTLFKAYPTITCLMMSYPVSWGLTFIALITAFAISFKKVRANYTAEELAIR